MSDQTSQDKIVEAVREKLLARSRKGMEKYGQGVDRDDLTRLQWLQHAREEAMDLAIYLQKLIEWEKKYFYFSKPTDPDDWSHTTDPPKPSEQGVPHGSPMTCPTCGFPGRLNLNTPPSNPLEWHNSVWWNPKEEHWECVECWLK